MTRPTDAEIEAAFVIHGTVPAGYTEQPGPQNEDGDPILALVDQDGMTVATRIDWTTIEAMNASMLRKGGF